MIKIEASTINHLNYTKLFLMAFVSLMVGVFSRFMTFGELLPLVFLFVFAIIVYTWKKPFLGVYVSLGMGFFSAGLARYLALPWGLTIDIFLSLSLIVVMLNRSLKLRAGLIKDDLIILSWVWMGYLLLEILNPQSLGLEAWFYAMRGIGFYQALTFTMVFLLVKDQKLYDSILHTILFLSILGSLWGLRQQVFGTDSAEDFWLYSENHHEEHILHGVLRVFSFYSDAGQFGASQAMVSLVSALMLIGKASWGNKIFYFVAFVLTFIGFAISGTRGALAVPAAGGIVYLIVSRNFKILISGFILFGVLFYLLKYTFLLQGVEQVRRMRSALDPENPSLLVRLENQKTFRSYLADKPMGGGIGSAGYWGARFAPNSLLANTATDSWYVKIWAETGILGISFHLFFLGFIMGKGGAIVWNISNPQLKTKAIAMYSGIAGVLLSSYGNQVFGQMPTGMVMNLFIPLVFLAPFFDTKSNSQ